MLSFAQVKYYTRHHAVRLLWGSCAGLGAKPEVLEAVMQLLVLNMPLSSMKCKLCNSTINIKGPQHKYFMLYASLPQLLVHRKSFLSDVRPDTTCFTGPQYSCATVHHGVAAIEKHCKSPTEQKQVSSRKGKPLMLLIFKWPKASKYLGKQ